MTEGDGNVKPTMEELLLTEGGAGEGGYYLIKLIHL